LAAWASPSDVVCTQLYEMLWASITSNHSASRSRHLHVHAGGLPCTFV
jgi:hypothetical protein